MSTENTDLLRVLVENAITPSLVLALIIIGVLVTKRQYDESIRMGAEWRDLFMEEREQRRRESEALRDVSNTLARVLDELHLSRKVS